MDTCHEHEDSKNSSDQEINQATDDGDDTDTGTGRSYECVFCKRGFTTSQALGGHMNIHRKDRVKAKPSTTQTRPPHESEYYSNPSLFYSSNLNPSTPQLFSTNFGSRIGYDHMYFAAAASGSSSRPHHGYQMDDSLVQSSRRLKNPYGQEEWFTSLSLHIGPAHVQDSIGKKGQGCNGTEEELDLELRLGHDT